MKKSLLFVAAIATLTIVTPALASAMHDDAAPAIATGLAFDPVADADILALGGAPGTAVLVAGTAIDRNADADLIALGLVVGNATPSDQAAFDPIADADIVALRGFGGGAEPAACCAMASSSMACHAR